MELGLFYIGNEGRAKCIYFGEQGFLGMHFGYGDPLYRMIELMGDRIRICDYFKYSTLKKNDKIELTKKIELKRKKYL